MRSRNAGIVLVLGVIARAFGACGGSVDTQPFGQLDASSEGSETGGSAGAGGASGATGAGAGGTTAGAGGSAGVTGAGGAAGSAGASGTGGSAGQGGSAGAAGAGGGAACATNCREGLTCCNNECVRLSNDVRNCGGCGVVCKGAAPYCDNGMCGTPPCTSSKTCAGTCCGDNCCQSGELCCVVPGPLGTPNFAGQCTKPSDTGTCPVGCAPLCKCASPDTPIATPEGDRPIASLRAGDLVYSVHRGRVQVVPIRAVNRVPASHHEVMHVELEGGSAVEISAAHPMADGRTLGDLHAGDWVDGVRVLEARRVPYVHEHTYDILPDSDTGTYYAGGVLIGSTLFESSRRPTIASESVAPSCSSPSR